MHSVVLGTAGYTLLVSSLFSLFYVLRKKVKSFTISSLHTFAISDILSSFITGVLLIFNQYLTIGSPVEHENFNYASFNRTYTEFFGETKSSGQFSEHMDKFIGRNETTSVCRFRDVVAHYAMFIFPFVNAFVSLLSFSARTCIDLDRVVGECEKFVDIRKKGDRTNFSRYKNEKLLTGLGLAGQWIVPILLTAVFNFAGDGNLENFECYRDMGCIYGMNFPFDNCYANGNNDGKYFNKSAYTLPAFNDYIAAIDSSQFSANHSIEIEEKFGDIVSKIYDIVESATIHNESEQMKSTTFYESTHLSNITKFMEKKEQNIIHQGEEIQNQTGSHDDGIMNVAEITENEEKGESEMLENHEEIHNVPITEIVSSTEFHSNERPSTSVASNEEFSEEDELELFQSLLANSSETLSIGKIPEAGEEQWERIFNSSKVDSASEESTYLENVDVGMKDEFDGSGEDEPMKAEVLVQTDKQIYADIVKKIQAVATQLGRRKNVELLRKNTERGRSRKYSNGNIIDTTNENVHEMPACMKNQCFVSTNFLKIHLLVLVFIVYFVPIFSSAILQTRAKYACRNMREKLAAETGTKKNNTDSELVGISKSNSMQNVAGTSGWFQPETKYGNDFSSTSLEDLVVPEKSVTNTDKLEQPEKKINRDSSINIIDQCANSDRKTLEIMAKDVCGMEKLLELFQTSFLLAILSWTPIFLELLTKVFLCMSTVEWLFDVSFLGALLFGIARNILNLRMIRVLEVIRNDCIKENSILPSS